MSVALLSPISQRSGGTSVFSLFYVVVRMVFFLRMTVDTVTAVLLFLNPVPASSVSEKGALLPLKCENLGSELPDTDQSDCGSPSASFLLHVVERSDQDDDSWTKSGGVPRAHAPVRVLLDMPLNMPLETEEQGDSPGVEGGCRDRKSDSMPYNSLNLEGWSLCSGIYEREEMGVPSASEDALYSVDKDQGLVQVNLVEMQRRVQEGLSNYSVSSFLGSSARDFLFHDNGRGMRTSPKDLLKQLQSRKNALTQLIPFLRGCGRDISEEFRKEVREGVESLELDHIEEKLSEWKGDDCEAFVGTLLQEASGVDGEMAQEGCASGSALAPSEFPVNGGKDLPRRELAVLLEKVFPFWCLSPGCFASFFLRVGEVLQELWRGLDSGDFDFDIPPFNLVKEIAVSRSGGSFLVCRGEYNGFPGMPLSFSVSLSLDDPEQCPEVSVSLLQSGGGSNSFAEFSLGRARNCSGGF